MIPGPSKDLEEPRRARNETELQNDEEIVSKLIENILF